MADNEQMLVRLSKREELAKKYGSAYPVAVNSLTTYGQLRQASAGLNPNESRDFIVHIAGRVMRVRHVGRISFVVLQDGNGNQLQGLFSRATIGEDSHSELKSIIDLGDFLELTGNPGISSSGESSLFVTAWRVLSKAIRSLPNQQDSLSEETRVRQRYLDFILNKESREQMVSRSRVISRIRRMMEDSGYLEVETPMLQVQQGGANARPFITESNALDADLYLRIAPELFLKRAVIGGFHRVFEINKNFRNEGMDSTHAPEFTMMEAYQAYADYEEMASSTEAMIRNIAEELKLEQPELTRLEPWNRISLYGSLSEALGETISPDTSVERLLALATAVGVGGENSTHGKLVEELWDVYVKPKLQRPTFVFDYPEDSSPLVAPHRSTPGLVEKWDLYLNGFEVATGYSELVDPVIQRERLERQAALRSNGDSEAMAIDEEFLEALEHGMPPTGGIGMGIDRLLMVLFNRGIRETVMFPLVK